MIIAIDPSLTATAVVVGDEKGFRVETFACPRKSAKVVDRIHGYSKTVREILVWIGHHDTEPLVLIEGYAFSRNGEGARWLTEFGAVLRFRLCGLGWNPIEVQPTSLQKFATGKGKATKEIVSAHLTKRYGVLLGTSDEYDAYGLYRMGLVMTGLAEAQTNEQRAAIDAVLNPPAKKPRKKK